MDPTVFDRLETQHIYWSEVLPLLQNKWTLAFLRVQSVLDDPKYNVLAVSPDAKHEKLVIDHKTPTVTPYAVSDTVALTTLATHSKAQAIRFPLAAADEHQADDNVATIGFKPAKPNLRYTITYKGEPIVANRTTPMAFLSMNEAMKFAYDLGAATAHVPIPKSVRRYFQSCYDRSRIVETAFKDLDIHMNQWAKSQKLNFTRFNKSIARGDNYPECREAISAFVKMDEGKLWPDINWSDLNK